MAEVGQNVRDAAVLALKQFEESTLDVTVEYRTVDTETDKETGIEGATALVDEGYPAVVGPLTSEVTLPVAREVFPEAEVVGCSPSATTPELTEVPDTGYMYRTAPSDAFQGAVLARLLAEDLNGKTAAILFMNDSYGKALAKTFKNRFQLRGGEIAAHMPFEPGKDTYAAELETALADDPDALALIAFTESGAVIFNEYYERYEGHDILVPDGLKTVGVMQQVDHDLDNVTGTVSLASGPNEQAFTARFREHYDTKPAIYTAHSYDAAVLLTLASLASDGTGAGIRDNLQSVANPQGHNVGPDTLVDGARQVIGGKPIEYQGASSSVEFDRNGDVRTAKYEVWEYDPPVGFSRRDTIEFAK